MTNIINPRPLTNLLIDDKWRCNYTTIGRSVLLVKNSNLSPFSKRPDYLSIIICLPRKRKLNIKQSNLITSSKLLQYDQVPN